MTTTNAIATYVNGNAKIEIQSDGTRIIDYDQELKLEWPLNIDIRVSNRCSNGLNPKTGLARCAFCHESATTDGAECDYDQLIQILKPLPRGVELAIGCNHMTRKLRDFVQRCHWHGWVVNLTINQDHVGRDYDLLVNLIHTQAIQGLGISYRRDFMNKYTAPFSKLPVLLAHKNTVMHVIEGIDDFERIFQLKDLGVRKLLVLGEKDFGFNLCKVTKSLNHMYWLRNVHRLFNQFEVVSFDNLAIERLDIRRFFNSQSWDMFHQGEHSFYINAVDQTFAPSSRSPKMVSWHETDIKTYFASLQG